MTDNDPAAFAAGIYPDVPELDYHSGRFGPHLISVVHLDEFFPAAGYARMRRALDTLNMRRAFNF